MEIEIKVKIENTENLLKLLEAEGSKEYEERQVDEYFNAPNRDFTATRPIEEWLRLRESDGSYSVNYKKWHYDEHGISHYADEYETRTDSNDAMRKLFAALGFVPLVTVSKKRTAWRYQDYEIAFDSVDELGNFVEIEYKAPTDGVDPQHITEEMLSFLASHDCGAIERTLRGYPYMLLEKRGFLR